MNESFAIQGFSQTNSLLCLIEGENIVQTDYVGNRKTIGKTLSAYKELEDTCAEYYDKLVDLGVIVKPKTQEQMIADLQQTVVDLMREIKEMKQNGIERNSCRCVENVPQHKCEGSCGEGTADATQADTQ